MIIQKSINNLKLWKYIKNLFKCINDKNDINTIKRWHRIIFIVDILYLIYYCVYNSFYFRFF